MVSLSNHACSACSAVIFGGFVHSSFRGFVGNSFSWFVSYLIANGLIGDPTAPVIGSGGATKKNS